MKLSSELNKRIITGFLGGSALISLIVFGGWIGIFILTSIIITGIISEFTSVVYKLTDQNEKRYVLLCMAWLILMINLVTPQIEHSVFIFSFLSLFIYFLITAKRHGNSETTLSIHFKELMFSIFGISYLVFIPILLPKLYETDHGVSWVLLFFSMIWAGDSVAYFIGKRYGKRKLYPLISPKKTIMGAVSGLTGAILVAVCFRLFTLKDVSWIAFIVIPILVSGVAQMGDLCESFFKRAFNIKDSGSILPGHGGFLDRFDSVIFSLPIMYSCVRIFT